MKSLPILFVLLAALAGPVAAQHEPAQAEAGHADAAVAASAEAATAHEAGEHAGELGAAEIFLGLFKHLEPHAVTALWLGGSRGFAVLPPYETLPDGSPAHLDEHGHPVGFHSRQDLEERYGASMGGGFGLLVYNINTAQWIAGLALALVVILGARAARRMAGQVPRGAPFHLLESIVLFVRDDMVYAVMGKEHGRRFVPLFLTQFFFILFMNLLGLVWLGSIGGTATANLAVTLGMALTTLFWIHFSGIRAHGFLHHWKNFVPHGLPWFVLPIIIPVEILGMLVKPAALTIRLFANMTAGHLVMLGFFGLVYLFGAKGVPALAMAIAINCLELFVCFVQAYIFTYLSVIFVGASVHPEH